MTLNYQTLLKSLPLASLAGSALGFRRFREQLPAETLLREQLPAEALLRICQYKQILGNIGGSRIFLVGGGLETSSSGCVLTA